MNKTTITNTKINADFFRRIGYTEIELNKYQRQLGPFLFQFDVIEDHPELGTNIEVRVNQYLCLTGYWDGTLDFGTHFRRVIL